MIRIRILKSSGSFTNNKLHILYVVAENEQMGILI